MSKNVHLIAVGTPSTNTWQNIALPTYAKGSYLNLRTDSKSHIQCTLVTQ
jgi:hypothetical protein